MSRRGSIEKYTSFWDFVPVDGNMQHLQGHRKNRKVLPYLVKNTPTARQRLRGHSGFKELSGLERQYPYHSVILIRTWLTIKVSVFDQVCASRVLPASSSHRLFEGDHPQYTTVSTTNQAKFQNFSSDLQILK